MLTGLGKTVVEGAGRGRAGGVIVNEHVLSRHATRRHVEVLGRWFDFIPHDALLERLKHPGKRPFCLLTFDDGRRNNVTEVAPVLEALGVPAVFFVTTGFLSSGKPLWSDVYARLLQETGRVPEGLEPETVKRLPFDVVTERVEKAYRQSGIGSAWIDDRIRPMSWEECRQLARRGFTIAAHGVTHAILPNETLEKAKREIEDGIAAVRAEIGCCPSFAFPNGNYTAALARHALASGVSTVMTTEPLWAGPQMPAWRLPRIQLFEGQPDSKIQLKLLLALSGRWLKNPDGTGKAYRRIQKL